jgi:hypothetical protein
MSASQASSKVSSDLLKNADFQRVLADALSIQDRFSAEPVFARTGKGHLRSVGVEELKSPKSKTLPANSSSTTANRK